MAKLEFKCIECGHVWKSRTNPNPKQCPNPPCRSTSILSVENYKNLLNHIQKLKPISYPNLEAFITLLVEQRVLPKRFVPKLVVIQRLMEEAGWFKIVS